MGGKSPFHYLLKINQKIYLLVLIIKDAFTMDHYFEQIANVKYIINLLDQNILMKMVKLNKEYDVC